MKPETEIVDRAAFLRALAGKPAERKVKGKREKAKGATTTSEPGVGDQHDALKRLAALGYMPRWRAHVGYDFWSTSDPRTTTACAVYADAVRAAERELRER